METTLATTNGNGHRPALIPADLGVNGLADAFVKSGFFKDTTQQAQAIVKILYGQELGVGPVSAMLNIHVIEGKPAISSGLAASLIKRSGRYNYVVAQSDERACVIVFTDNGRTVGEASFTAQDAARAGVGGKQNWQRYPKAMLFARALTQGARMYCADIFLGAIYDPEELGAEEAGEVPATVNGVPVIEMPKRAGPSMWNVRDEAQEPAPPTAPVTAKDVTPAVVRAADPDTGELFDNEPAQPHPQSPPKPPDTLTEDGRAAMRFVQAIVTKSTKLGMPDLEVLDVCYAVTGIVGKSLHSYDAEALRRIANMMQSFKTREAAAKYVEEKAGEKREDGSPFEGLPRTPFDPDRQG